MNSSNFSIQEDGTVSSPQGFWATAVSAHIKYKDRLDLALVVSELDCVAAAVFTQNQVAAAPVLIDRETIAQNNRAIRAIVVNAGIANACTGKLGMDNGRFTQQSAAQQLNCQPNQVLILSTGVIGMQLPMEKLTAGIESAVPKLAEGNGRLAAQAIMTTDTMPKHLAIELQLSSGTVTIGGMAKGSGMIHPNMATMLGILTTDAQVEPELLDGMLKTAVDHSFNRISIDGDTSTNDTVLLLANGTSNIPISNENDIALFQNALTTLCTILAKKIVQDGEGATKFVEIQVTGAQTDADAQAVAKTIATSPLVKTAFAGSDPNWGRILAAAGRAGIAFDQHKTSLSIGIETTTDLQLVADGTPKNYGETDAARIFAQPAFQIQLDLGENGNGNSTMWTTDLTHEYVSINADYRS